MCGIAGYIGAKLPVEEKILECMSTVLQHRGPDDSGVYISPDKQIGIVHRRLSFIDLSIAGHQPMISIDGKIIVSLNGEIYNFEALRNQLIQLGCIFQSQSDTEVLIHGYKIWGQKLPEHLKGMFAFALLDNELRKIFLVRDRFGIKPIYYSISAQFFSFGSEIKAILELPDAEKIIRKQSVAEFLANRYVPTPNTMWENIYKLPPASYLEFDLESFSFEIRTYWKLEIKNLSLTKSQLNEQVAIKLQTAVSEHLCSDVPIGSFLSGGMDSTVLVSLMKKEVGVPEVFSIGFENWEQSEHQYAKIASDALGANLHSIIMQEISMETVSSLMHHYDDPIADISILPTYAVSGLAVQSVKAVLSGEGADECFGGYWWQQPAKFWFANTLERIKAKLFGTNFSQIKNHYIQAMSMGLFDNGELKEAFGKEWQLAIPFDPFSHLDKYQLQNASTLKQIQYLDLNTFMYELILNKVDRASMAHSLEVRVPFLDHELVEYVFSFNENAYFDPATQKTPIKQILKGKVPQEIYNRPKQGFVGPDVFYMNFDIYAKKLNYGRLVSENIINKDYLDKLFQTKDHWRLWKLFVLENWWERWVD